MSSLAHFCFSAPKLNETYNQWITEGINPGRWVEYSFSSSLMIVLIALIFGISDIAALIGLGGANVSMILFGWSMELRNRDHRRAGSSDTTWEEFIFGCIAGVGGSIQGKNSPTRGVPAFVYGIFASLFFFFNLFALNMLLQYKKVWKWERYLFGEKIYIALSFVAKFLLAWQVYGATFSS